MVSKLDYSTTQTCPNAKTYVHVQRLPVASFSANNGRDDHQLVFGDKIANASLVLVGVVCLDGVDVELQCRRKRCN
jgi:hypothetical protein